MRMQRARGEVSLSLRRRGERTSIADLRQDGCLKARFPNTDGLEAILLNNSGGVAGGDQLRVSVALDEAASATISSATAEKFYRALPDDAAASVHSRVTLAAGAALHWLPQEAILFNRCAADRRLHVVMAEDASFLGVEALVFGRAAMGETLGEARIADTIRVERAGRLILHDAIRLSGDVAAMLARPAIAAGGAAVATILLVAPGAAGQLDPLREALDGAAEAGVEAGASSWDGMLAARIVARDGACLRAAIVAGLTSLRGGRPLPRVWQC